MAVAAPMLAQFEPMLPMLVKKPFSDPGWVYEPKWDGWRATFLSKMAKVTCTKRAVRRRIHTWAICGLLFAMARSFNCVAQHNTGLQRTRHERPSLLSNLGEPLKRGVQRLPKLG